LIVADQELREMFRSHDKDMSGFISKDDVLCMLLGADKDEQKDPVFKTHLKFLINVIKQADKDGDMKISFEEFKSYIEKASS
uniref:EF-hand domain-containing protein n=1 Tax=Heligmosomoides polygyrus TaxID=6339 RepID=A0A183F467_HELPZ